MESFFFFISHPETLFKSVFLLVDAFIVTSALRMLWRLSLNRSLVFRSKNFSVYHPDPLKKILILGDSTAVGAGAERIEDTLAGQLSRDLPQVAIHNYGENGARVRDLLPILTSIGSARYDLVIISIGGNDVLYLSNSDKLKHQLETVLDWVNRLSQGHVILLGYSNIGSAPLFPRWLRRYLGKRSLRQREIFRKTSLEKDVRFIDLLTEDLHDPFSQNPKVFFAQDGIHPSSAGYHLWYRMMWHNILEPTCPWYPSHSPQ